MGVEVRVTVGGGTVGGNYSTIINYVHFHILWTMTFVMLVAVKLNG